MIPKSIDQITESDLKLLIDNSVLERKTIEYKERLPGNSDSEKIAFLAWVSSFANASGGDLIFGISENRETGAPDALIGLDIANIDKEVTRLDSILRTGIEPRIPSFSIEPIKLSSLKVAIVVRVFKSWISPHRVIFKGHDKFYTRGVNGKYPLDVAELRTAFNLSETVTEKIRKFREDRISNILSNELPVPFRGNAKIVLHLIPLSSFNLTQQYNIQNFEKLYAPKLRPMFSVGYSHRFNLDGFLTHTTDKEGHSYSYVQFFRNGILEAVESVTLESYDADGKPVISSNVFEERLISALQDFLSFFKELNVDMPILLFLSLVGVKGYSMAIDRLKLWPMKSEVIEKDVLLLQEILIENYDSKVATILRPIFDSVWNSCGFAKSYNYNDAGEWKRH